jgi:hypothetical protein
MAVFCFQKKVFRLGRTNTIQSQGREGFLPAVDRKETLLVNKSIHWKGFLPFDEIVPLFDRKETLLVI